MSLGKAYKVKGGGYFELNTSVFKEVPNDPGVVSECVRAANGVAASASAIADEVYTVDSVRGQFRTYTRVTGEPEGTAGYWRGVSRQALWSSTAGWQYGGRGKKR